MKEVKRRRFRLIGMKGDELWLEGGGGGMEYFSVPLPALLCFTCDFNKDQVDVIRSIIL